METEIAGWELIHNEKGVEMAVINAELLRQLLYERELANTELQAKDERIKELEKQLHDHNGFCQKKLAEQLDPVLVELKHWKALAEKGDTKEFLKWVFLSADKIYVEHTLGWRDNAIEEMYEAYKKSLKTKSNKQ